MSNKSNINIPLRIGLFQNMAYMDVNDCSNMSHFIEEFHSPFLDRPFITEIEENYEMLWQFKGCVDRWTLGISCTKGCAHLLHKEPNSPIFLPLNVSEKVILVEQFNNKYTVIGIQAMDLAGGDMQHVYSFVVKPGKESAHFDIDGMLENLSSTGQWKLADILRPRYSLWSATNVVS